MVIGLKETASLPQGFARLELGVGAPTFSPGQIVNGRVAQVGPKGVVIEVAGRLATMLSDLQLEIGEMVQLSVKEASREQTLLQMVGRDGQLLGAQATAENPLARLIASYRLPMDRPHLNAVRRLLARGLPITRENLERLIQGQPSEPSSGLDLEATDSVLARLLGSYELPVDEPNLQAARQLLARGLPLNKESIEQLTRTMARLGASEEMDFQAATYLQANRLPITASTLAVMRAYLESPATVGGRLHQLGRTLASLAELLRALSVEEPLQDEDLQGRVDQAAQQLSERIVAAGGEDRARLVESLRRVFKDQGASAENRLARVLTGSADPAELEGDLRVLLGRLAEMVSEATGKTEMPGAVAEKPPAARAISRDGAVLRTLLPESPELRRLLAQLDDLAPELADLIQAQQLKNAGQPRDSSEQWLAFQVPISGTPRQLPQTAELRISRRAGGKIDPQRVRLVLQVELERYQRVELRLDVLGNQVNCHLAGSNEDAVQALRERFPSLQEGLERLGYRVGAAAFGLLSGEPDPTAVAVAVPQRLVQVDLRA